MASFPPTTMPASIGSPEPRRDEQEALPKLAIFEHLASFVQHTSHPVVLCGPDRTVIWVNAAFVRLSGYTLNEIVGKSPGSLLQCELTDSATRQRVSECLALEQSVRVEILNRSKSGRHYWIDLAIEPLRNAAGALTGFLSWQPDISDQIAQRQRWLAAFHNRHIGMLVLDAVGGQLLECNPCAAKLLGGTGKPPVGLRLEAFVGHFVNATGERMADGGLAQLLALAQADGSKTTTTLGYVRADQSLAWFTVCAELSIAQQPLTGQLLVSLIDISPQRAAHLEAQRTLSELQAYRSALDQHAIVSATDRRGEIIYANARFCEVSGYSLDELLGQDHRILQSPHNPLRYFEDLWATVSSGQTWRGEICNKAKNGRLFWVDSAIVPVLDAQGDIEQYVGIFYDITQRRLGERHLRESRERFKRLLAMSSDWYWETDTEHRITLMSEGIDQTGISRLSLMGKTLWELEIDPDDRNWDVHRATVAARRAISRFEFRVRNPVGSAQSAANNEWLWLSISGEPMQDASGNFSGYRGVGRDVTSRRSAQDQLWELANLDSLTGLPNRMRFNDALAHAVTQAQQLQHPFALAIIDLDNFKELNDSLGHDVGDELLTAVAKRLCSALRGNDLIARLGGDEFGVLIHGLGTGPNLTRPLDAMMNAMEAPIPLAGQLRRFSLSMGVTLYPADSSDSANLIKNADIALYRAKASGRGQYVMFHPQLKSDVDRQANLMQDMENAIRDGNLFLHYQPVVDMASHSVLSLEALLRWEHPVRGIVSVGVFPQVFENLGLAAQIGRLVTTMAVKQAAQWQKEGVAFNKIAINVTAGDFLLGAFPASLAEQLTRHGVPASAICIEVTEGMFLGRKSVPVLDGLRVLGAMDVEVAFDDFGTGYASLMHLKLPINRLKIDRSFVHDIETDSDNAHVNAAIVHAVTDLGRRLGKGVTVEGVETLAQLRTLVDIGCSQFQGNFFSKPLPPGEIPVFIDSFNANPLTRNLSPENASPAA